MLKKINNENEWTELMLNVLVKDVLGFHLCVISGVRSGLNILGLGNIFN